MFGNPFSLLLPLLLAACDGGEVGEVGDGNDPPVAIAGPDQVVSADAPILLDGGSSYDPNGDDFILHWVLQTAPEGSDTVEGTFPYNHTAARETLLRPDLPGTYIIELWVEDARGAISAPDLVTVTVVAGSAPIADARGPEHGLTGDTLTLDGTWSYDPKGHDLTYGWALVSSPSTSAVTTVEDPEQITVSVVPDVPGLYVFSLTVNNGFIDSPPDLAYVTIDPLYPEAPIADPGDTIRAQDCTTVALDGEDSYDPNGAPLDYLWEIDAKPEGSAITTSSLDDTRSPTPSFFPDVAGTYTASLTVFDGTEWSQPASVDVEASERTYNTAPEVEVGSTIWVDLGDATCRSKSGRFECDPCGARLVDLGDKAWAYDADGDEMAIEWVPFTGEDINIVSSDSLDAEILFDSEYPDGPGSCEQNLYHIWLTATDCPGAQGTDLLSVWATCCGVL